METDKPDNGVVLFDEFLNDDDFLEFLVEWSDTIAAPKDGSTEVRRSSFNNNYTDESKGQPLKRKLDVLSNSPTRSLADIDADLVRLPIGANSYNNDFVIGIVVS